MIDIDTPVYKDWNFALQIGRHEEWDYLTFHIYLKKDYHREKGFDIELFGWHFIIYLYNSYERRGKWN